MEIIDILDSNTICLNLEDNCKKQVLNTLSEKLFEQEYITNIDAFMDDIYKREEQGQTGIGNYIAIPHGLSSSVKKVGVAIGILKNEIKWESLDGKGVKYVILFSVGNDVNGASEHLKLLSLFARKLGNDEVINNIKKAEDVSQVMAAFK